MAYAELTTSNDNAQSSLLHSLSGTSASSLAEVAHDAQNMVAALGLYSDLLEEPGVFAEPYRHYGHELKTVANTSRSLVDKLLALCETNAGAQPLQPGPVHGDANWPIPAVRSSKTARYWNEVQPKPIQNFAWELQTNRDLLAALAGPSTTLTLDAVGGALPVGLSAEDLTRILVKLVKNSVEAMSESGGRIQLILRECQPGPGEETRLLLNIEDNGAGIAPETLEHVFKAGYTTHLKSDDPSEQASALHRGLGLSITRSILDAAGGSIRAANRDPVGACIQIELPTSASE